MSPERPVAAKKKKVAAKAKPRTKRSSERLPAADARPQGGAFGELARLWKAEVDAGTHVLVCMPPLELFLGHVERQKGAPLNTKERKAATADAPAIVMEASAKVMGFLRTR